MSLIYQNNDVRISSEIIDQNEAKINVNGDNLICILRADEEEFKRDLSILLDRYKI